MNSNTNLRKIFFDLLPTIRLVWSASPIFASVVIITSLLQAFAPAATLWVSKLLIDAVTLAIQGKLENAFPALTNLLLLQVLISAIAMLLGTIQSACRELLGDAVLNSITAKILHKAASLELAHFENSKTYDALKNAYSSDVGIRPITVASQVLALIQAIITLSSIGVLLAQLGWLVVVLTLLATLPGIFVSNRFGLETYNMIRRRTPEARMQSYMGSLLTSDQLVKEVRLFGSESYLISWWQMFYRSFRKQLTSLVVRRNVWGFAAGLLSTIMTSAATLTVLSRAALGQITVGDFTLFVGGLGQIQNQFTGILTGFSTIYQSMFYMQNLFEFLELPQRDLDEGLVWDEEINHLEFRNVTFQYPLTNRDVLSNVSFSIQKGQALALVGENGAGKTSIVKLLTRLYDPTSGQILLNGKDIQLYSSRSVQRQMSIIFQDYGQYQMTARENIAFSKLDHIDKTDELTAAGKRSQADEFVQALPSGYETMLGRMFEGGWQLSGGQWQRLALSRLYFRQASVLVFDEPTAALDAQAEFDIVSSLRDQTKDRISVLVSHRFSTVKLADNIIVLEHGQVKEIGSHQELLAQKGMYARLFRLQAQGYYPMNAD